MARRRALAHRKTGLVGVLSVTHTGGARLVTPKRDLAKVAGDDAVTVGVGVMARRRALAR